MILDDGLNAAMAWGMLHNPEVARELTTESYLELCKAAGYGEDASQRAAKEWGFKRIAAGLPA